MVRINEGDHILKLKYGEVDDWCLSKFDINWFYREEGATADKATFLEGREAIERLIEIIDEKHEAGEFDHNFQRAEQALQDMLTEVYGLSFEKPESYFKEKPTRGGSSE